MSRCDTPIDTDMIVRNSAQLLKLTAFKLGVPFVAFALYDHEDEEIRWCDAYGSLQKRFKSIAIQKGIGIAGQVVRFKVPVILNSTSDESLCYPIIKTENLTTSMAVPIGQDDQIYGVLLAGRRQEGWAPEAQDKEFLRFVAAQIDQLCGGLVPPSGTSTNEQSFLKESPLIAFLYDSMKSSNDIVKLDILDQSMSQMSKNIQEDLVKLLRKVFKVLLSHDTQEIHIILERSPYKQFSMQVTGDRIVPKAWSTKWAAIQSLRFAGCQLEPPLNDTLFRLRIFIPCRSLAKDKLSDEEVIGC